MNKTLKTLTATLVPASLLFAAGAAEARGRKLLPRLVQTGALVPAELAGLRAIRADLRACRDAVRAGAQPRGACIGKHLAEIQARRAILAQALPKVQIERLRMRVTRAIAVADRRIAKMQRRAARRGAPMPMPPPPPAQ